MTFVLGLTARAGAVFGNPGPFFFSQEFALGGVQYGEQLRGYDEFSITPTGTMPRPTTSARSARVVRQRVLHGDGRARVSASISRSTSNLFYDAGNVYANSRASSTRRGCSAAPASASLRHSARATRARLMGTASTDWTLRAAGTRSGSSISNSVSSSNIRSSFMRLTSFARRIARARHHRLSLPELPLAQAPAPTARKIAYIDSVVLLAQAPGRAEAEGAVRQGDGGLPRSRSSGWATRCRRCSSDYPEGCSRRSTAHVREQRECAIRQKQERLSDARAALDQQMQQRQVELVKPIMDRSRRCSTTIRTEDGYAIIFDVGSGPGVIVAADKNLDITEKVSARAQAGRRRRRRPSRRAPSRSQRPHRARGRDAPKP